MVPCIGYVRVSTERQAGEKQTSLADQETAITALAVKLSVTVDSWYRDEGKSGATVDQRPALLRLLADCKAAPRPKSSRGLVLVLNDSRWGRFPNPEEATYWRHELERVGWIVRFAEGDDIEDGIGRHVMRIVSSELASQYRVAIKRNAKRGSRGTAEQGYWGTAAPYGYRRKVVHPVGRERVLATGQRKAIDEKVALTPHDEEAAVVLAMFTRYSDGTQSLATLTQWLRDTQPARRWSRQAIRATLLNPAYVGDVVSGRVSNDQPGRRPETEWIVTENAHPAIVGRDMFALARFYLGRNEKWTNHVASDWLVSGVVTCRCGKTFVSGGGSGKNKAYRCASKVLVRSERCAFRGTVNKHWLESAVLASVANVVSSETHRAKLAAHLDTALAALRQAPEQAITAIVAQISAASAVRDRLVGAVAEGTLVGDEAKGRLDTVRRQISRLEGQRDALLRASVNQESVDQERAALLDLMADFRRVVSDLRGPQLREMISPWLASATYDTDSRRLNLAIRNLPHISSGGLAQMGWHDEQTTTQVVRRSVRVGRGK